jgi:uncharacterized protein YceK
VRRVNRKPARTLVLAVLALVLAGQPGCLVGSPLAAISGRLYGMTRDDVAAIRGTDKNAIWKGLPALAVIDIPFAFVLDTGFLPIALIFAGFDLLIGDEDHGHGTGPGQHTHDDEDEEKDEEKPHTHEDGTTHSHDGDGEKDAKEAARERDAKATRERLERERLEREDAERRRKDEAREEAMRERAAGQPTDQERREADLRREREELDAERARLAREREAFERERGGVAPVASPTPR